jgi:hypothetical protein
MLVAIRALDGLIVLIHDDEASVMKRSSGTIFLTPAPIQIT